MFGYEIPVLKSKTQSYLRWNVDQECKM